MPNPYASIDLETTGLNPDTCQILEVGIVIDDWVTPIDELPVFHCYVTHDLIYGEPFALQMNAAILKKLAEGSEKNPGFAFVREDYVSESIASFLRHNGFNTSRVPVAGKNFAGFDRQFLRRLPEGNKLQFNQRVYDPAMLFWRPWEDGSPPDTKKCMKRAGIEGEVAHTAVADAQAVVKMIRFAAGRLSLPTLRNP